MATYIPDGYVETGYIAARKKLHGHLRFQYRPVLIDERSLFLDEYQRLEVHRKNRRLAEFLTARLTSWDWMRPSPSKAGSQEPVPLNATETPDEILRHMHPLMFDQLFGIIIGQEAGDDDPQAATPPAKFDEAAAAKN